MDCDIFQQDEIETQYSIIPLFHYSNCERSELSSFFPGLLKASDVIKGKQIIKPTALHCLSPYQYSAGRLMGKDQF